MPSSAAVRVAGKVTKRSDADLREGQLDGAVTSPPWEDSIGNAAGAPETKRIRLHLPPAGDVAAYLRARRKAKGLSRKQCDDYLGTTTLYSWYEGRPAGIEIPTPEHWRKLKDLLELDDRFDDGILAVEEVEATSRFTVERTGHAKMDDYGASAGQIGKEQGETYWSAMSVVYEQCHIALKPGGVLCCVVKSYVKQGKLVDLPSQTWKLLLHLGFEPVQRIRAWLVKEKKRKGLFGQTVVERKSRKSFFRRLCEKKGSPPIDWEEVLVVRKSLTDGPGKPIKDDLPLLAEMEK